jgi:sporulation protein YlmC with PRC-barrel domain
MPNTDVPPVTADATDDMPATEMPTEAGTATEEPGVPVTGDLNPARVSNQLDFPVLSQDGEQIGEVDDMILDLDNRSVAYVIVSTGGFLGIGDKTIAVPWTSLTLQTGATGTDGAVSTPSGDATATGEATDGTATAAEGAATAEAGQGTDMMQENAFILQLDEETLNNAPDFDPNALPEMGQPAGDWDADINSYWQGGGAVSPPSGDATAAPEATATDEAMEGTATAAEGAATAEVDQAAGQPQALQGVVLASDVLGSTITLGAGQGTDGTGTDGTTATADAGADSGMDEGNLTATVEDLIVDTAVGNILYIVVNTTFDDGERWIPVPLARFQWDGMGGFMLNADGAMLQNAPFFQGDQFPDTTMSGWNSEFDSFWQNSGAGAGNGSGSGEATATP